jgi:hypothetical protein
MIKQLLFCFITVLVCTGIIAAQSKRKGSARKSAVVTYQSDGPDKGQGTPVPLARQILRDDSMVRDLTDQDGWSLAEVARRLKATRIDLNGDRVPEFIISGIGCGSANCPYWLYQQRGKQYIAIPGDFEGIFARALTSKTNGWRNLEFVYHSSSNREPTTVYVFNGRKYVAK